MVLDYAAEEQDINTTDDNWQHAHIIDCLILLFFIYSLGSSVMASFFSSDMSLIEVDGEETSGLIDGIFGQTSLPSSSLSSHANPVSRRPHVEQLLC